MNSYTDVGVYISDVDTMHLHHTYIRYSQPLSLHCGHAHAVTVPSLAEDIDRSRLFFGAEEFPRLAKLQRSWKALREEPGQHILRLDSGCRESLGSAADNYGEPATQLVYWWVNDLE